MPVVSATEDPNSPLDDSYGAMYIGTFCCAIIFGVNLLQTFNYFQRYREDPWYLKSSVAFVIACDTIHLLVIASLDYEYLITNYHNPSKLTHMVWQLPFEVLLLFVTIAIVQVSFIQRVFRLSNSKLLCIPLFLLALGQLGIGTSWVILAWPKKTYEDLAGFVNLVIVNNAVVCATDISITGSLCILLYRERTGFKRTDTLINKLILFIISTGVLPTIFVTLALIVFLVRPASLIFCGLYYVTGHLYTNSFVTSLNGRSIHSTDVIELTRSDMSFTPRDKSGITTSEARNTSMVMEPRDEKCQETEKNDGDFLRPKGPMDSNSGSLPHTASSLSY